MALEARCVDWLRYWQELETASDNGAGEADWPPSHWYREPGPDDLAWEDPVTGTRFVLARRELDRICRTALDWLQSRRKAMTEEAYAAWLSDYLTDPLEFCREHPDAPAAVRWLPELPAAPADRLQPGPWLRPARLGDLAVLQTGILWALAGATSGLDRHRLRVESLLAGLALHLPVGRPVSIPGVSEALWRVAARAAAAACVSPLTPEEKEELTALCAPYRVGVVKAHTIKVKSYYLQNNKLPSIRGASILLDSINRQRYRQFFRTCPDLIPEGLIYTGGAGALAVVPPGRAAAEAAAEWERLHEKVTLVARSVAVHTEVSLADLVLRFQAVNGYLERLLYERRGAKVEWWFSPGFDQADITRHAPEGTRPSEAHTWRKVRGKRLCHHCGLRPAAVMTPSADPEEVCPACAIKWEAGRRARRSYFGDLYARWAPELLDVPGDPQDLVELAAHHGDGQSIAVVYGDGNNMGEVLQTVETPGQLRQFSQRVETAVYRAVFPTLARHLGSRAVEFMSLGGDDLFFIMPADAALITAAAIVREFDRTFYNLTERRATMTLSMGIAVAKANTPVALLIATATDLLKSAKKRARRLQEQDRSRATGTVDIVNIESAGDPRSLREDPVGKPAVRLTLRPFTWREAERFCRLVEVLKDRRSLLGRSAIYQLRQMVTEGSPEEAELFYQYQLARRGEKRDGGWLQEFQERLDRLAAETRSADVEPGVEPPVSCRVSGPFWPVGGRGERETWVTPWVDVVELWNCAALRSERRASAPEVMRGG